MYAFFCSFHIFLSVMSVTKFKRLHL
uniref:Uncharacterized protein n=1 Tax=Anguilla anguilla TaxID=7936 RepID=A0A0E9P582_ANGAN